MIPTGNWWLCLPFSMLRDRDRDSQDLGETDSCCLRAHVIVQPATIWSVISSPFQNLSLQISRVY